MNMIIKNFFLFLLLVGCAKSNSFEEKTFYLKDKNISSGETIFLSSHRPLNTDSKYEVSLFEDENTIVEKYNALPINGQLVISRFLNKKTSNIKKYHLRVKEDNVVTNKISINILPSIVVRSFCASEDCEVLSGNVVEGLDNKIYIEPLKIKPTRFIYTFSTPYQNFEITHEYNSPTDFDYVESLKFNLVPEEVSFYVGLVKVEAYDVDDNYVETSLPFKVVRPIEVKHFGKHELAQTYEPIPVTGCIPGTIGSNVQYSESTSETRQNSVSISINKSWSDSFSNGTSQNISEGISIQETQGTVNASSLSESETQSESYTDSSTQGESSNISFNTSDGESWSWSLGETESQTEGSSNSENTNTSVNGSTTVGVSGEGSLPFIAKASGKVEVSAGIQRGWGETNTNSSSETTGKNRGYSTSGNSSSSKIFGSAQNDSRSHSLSGAYVLSNTTSSSISESSSLSSGRVWNMSESVSSGKVVTEGNSENIAQTIVTSNSSSTTFSYGGYIPRGRFGVFYRQTSRYVKISEIISYDLNGIPMHSGYIMMNSWAWAPELSIGESCEGALESHLPEALCIIPPCE